MIEITTKPGAITIIENADNRYIVPMCDIRHLKAYGNLLVVNKWRLDVGQLEIDGETYATGVAALIYIINATK